MAEPFSVRIAVRGYETDAQGHVNTAVYLQYAEHARWTLLQAAGIGQPDLLNAGVGPVNMETTVRFLRELRAGDEIDVSCEFGWGEGRSFRVEQHIVRADGVRAAEVTAVSGIMDLSQRRLVPDPRAALRPLAKTPELLGL